MHEYVFHKGLLPCQVDKNRKWTLQQLAEINQFWPNISIGFFLTEKDGWWFSASWIMFLIFFFFIWMVDGQFRVISAEYTKLKIVCQKKWQFSVFPLAFQYSILFNLVVFFWVLFCLLACTLDMQKSLEILNIIGNCWNIKKEISQVPDHALPIFLFIFMGIQTSEQFSLH